MARTPIRKAQGASLPVEIRLALFQLDERVYAWNEAHGHDTRERLTKEIDALAETLFLAVLRHFGSEAVREHFSDDAPWLDSQGSENTRFPLAASAPVNEPRSHALRSESIIELHPELAQLEQNIAETQRLVSRQIARIERMTEDGADTETATAVLHGLEQVVDYFYAQRERIYAQGERILDILPQQ